MRLGPWQYNWDVVGLGRPAWRALAALLALACSLAAFSPPALADDEPITVLAFGDSLTAGYGLAQGQAYPAVLLTKLRRAGYNVKVVNGGVSGDTTAGGRSRLGWALEDKPDLVILALGANDALRGLPPEQAEDNLDAMLAELTGKNIRVILAGMLAPESLGQDYCASFNGMYPRLAQKYGVTLYPFILGGVAGQPELNQRDGIHPNAKGAVVIAEGLYPLVSSELDNL